MAIDESEAIAHVSSALNMLLCATYGITSAATSGASTSAVVVVATTISVVSNLFFKIT